MTQTQKPSWVTRALGAVTTDSVVSKVFSASSVAALLTGAAYEWRLGWEQGIAARRGISVDYIELDSDPAATPVLIVILLLIVSALVCFAALLVPAFTAWPVPAAVGVWFLIKAPWDAVRHTHKPLVWIDLITAAALFLLSAAVAAVSRGVRRILRRRRGAGSPPLPAWLRSYISWMDRQVPAWWDGAVTALEIVVLISLLIFASFRGASWLGTWFGQQTAQPDQAVVQGDQVYGLLGEAPSGLMVVRAVEFCGASSPEAASSVRVTGKRSLLLNPEGLQVIRLRDSLRLVDHCPANGR